MNDVAYEIPVQYGYFDDEAAERLRIKSPTEDTVLECSAELDTVLE